MIKLNIISPILNEEKNVQNLFDGLKAERDKLIEKYEIKFIFVDDGSTDNTKKILKKLQQDNNFLKVVTFTKNFGHQNAVLAGLSEFDADLYLVLDADLQHDTKLIPQMLENMHKFNCEIVHMKRKYSDYEGYLKRLLSKTFYTIFGKLTGVVIPKGSADFFLVKKKVRDEIIKSKISHSFIRGFLHWSGYSKVHIEYEQGKRAGGTSKYTFMKQLEFALTGIYNYSNKLPVYIFIVSSIILAFSFIYLLFILFEFFFLDIPTSGWASTVVLILFFGSISIFFNSIILFVLFKIFNFSGKKPNYIKQDSQNNKND
tara:strand:+ start:738 stop:1682 length:945 start_codon:yes stop_codon:yes gene_type:complete